MRLAIAPIFLMLSLQVFPSTKILRIGLFNTTEPSEVLLQTGEGSYTVLGSGQEIMNLQSGTTLRLKNENGLLHLRTTEKDLGSYAFIDFKKNSWGSTLKVQRLDEGKKVREYYDDFTFKPIGNKIKVINEVYIEHYVAGVVESEAGVREPKEYYKVQAVICRTYALNNRRRHEAEGFQLCDKVHCQVYHSRNRNNPDITKATQETIGIVIVDSDINLVTAAFSSNCGGYTCNSEDVWSGKLGYLRGRTDENCLQEPHSYWRYTTTTSNWLTYLSRNHNYPVFDPTAREIALNYCPDRRYHSLHAGSSGSSAIDFVSVRHDLKLKSAFFSIEQVQDSVILEGRGYGHGVGLCQEGAMNMAKRGYSYDKILHYYYSDVHLVNLSVIDFFRSED